MQARQLLDGARAEITRADGKAAVLLGTVGATGGALVGVLAGRQWDPGALSAPGQILWWAGVVCWVGSLALLIGAVLPRRVRSRWEPGQPVNFFADVVRTGGGERLRRALESAVRDPLAPLLASLESASRIAIAKHRCVLGGAVAYTAAVFAALLSVLIR